MKPIDQYNEYGYCIFRKFFSDEEILEINHQVDRIYQKWLSENETEIFNNKLVNMHSLTDPEHFYDAPEQRVKFFNLITSIKLTEALESVFGTNLHFHNTQLFFNPSNTDRLPYWHRDMQYSDIEDTVQSMEQDKILSLHVRIPLVKESGVEVVKGTHKRWDTELERNVRFELKGHKNSDSLPNSELIELVPGDVLVFHAQMIHRGNYELNSSRKAFDLCIGKYHPLASNFLDERVLPTKKELDYIQNNHWYKLAQEITTNRLTIQEILTHNLP